jgi:hypothetical protein
MSIHRKLLAWEAARARRFSLASAASGLPEHRLVVLDDGGRLGQVGDVLPEPGEDGADALGSEVDRGRERTREFLAGHEPAQRPPDEPPARHVGGKPRVRRAPEQDLPHRAKNVNAGTVRGQLPPR